MSTPPPYPFRSRREIHSGEPKVYSDAPRDNSSVESPKDSVLTPLHGTPAVAPASVDTEAAPARGASRRQRSAPLPSFGEVTDSGAAPRVSASTPRASSVATVAETASETTGMRSRRLASERRAARKRKRRRRIRSFFILSLIHI